nr:Protein M03F8.1 [Haemonchus contortus]
MLDSARFSRLSADDEEAYATISINVAKVGFVGIFIPSLLLAAVALLNVNDKIEPWEGNNDTLTQTLLENIEMLRNGSYYYYHKDEQTGIIDATVIDSWYSNVFEGKYRYDFGYSFNNFCWIPEEEWMSSLYRASQLFIEVQLPIRIAVLISITYRLLLLHAAIQCKTVLGASTTAIQAAPYLLLNEFLFLISMFLYYSIHTSQDENLLYMIPILSALMLITFVLKMLSGNFIQIKGCNRSRVARLAFAFITGCVASHILQNANNVAKSMNCDQKVIPLIAVSEYIFLIMVFASYALDINDSRSLHMIVSCSAQDVEDYSRVKGECDGQSA